MWSACSSVSVHTWVQISSVNAPTFCSQKISTNLSCNICRIFERADICHLISCPWRHQWQRWYEKTSVHHVCKLKRIPALLLLLSLSLSLSVYFIPSLPVASSNKGLTGRAWRSWLLGGKGESHSWVGQASTPAKVMSCVHWEGGIGGMGSYLTQMFFFFLYGHLVWWGKKPRGLLMKCRVWVRQRGGDYERAKKLKYCPSAVCLYMWARLTSPEAFTPAASSALFELLCPRLLNLSCEICRNIRNPVPF